MTEPKKFNSLHGLVNNLMDLGRDTMDRRLYRLANTKDHYCILDPDHTMRHVLCGEADLYYKGQHRDGEPEYPVFPAGGQKEKTLGPMEPVYVNASGGFKNAKGFVVGGTNEGVVVVQFGNDQKIPGTFKFSTREVSNEPIVEKITKDHLRKARDKMRKATVAFNELAREYAKQECPLKVGDKTTILRKAHQGKTMEVRKITVDTDYTDRIPTWRVSGPVLKKDGSPSEHTGSLSQMQWDTLHETFGGDMDKYFEDFKL